MRRAKSGWSLSCLRALSSKPYLDPKEPTLFKDLYKEIIIRSPKKGRLFGVKANTKP